MYLLITVGFLGFGFFLEDYTQVPFYSRKMGGNLICEVAAWGSVMTDSGDEINLYEIWPAVPFFRKRVGRIVVDDNKNDMDATCADAVRAYEGKAN